MTHNLCKTNKCIGVDTISPACRQCCHVANDLTNFTGDIQTNERTTDEQTNRRTSTTRKALTFASGGLTNPFYFSNSTVFLCQNQRSLHQLHYVSFHSLNEFPTSLASVQSLFAAVMCTSVVILSMPPLPPPTVSASLHFYSCTKNLRQNHLIKPPLATARAD